MVVHIDQKLKKSTGIICDLCGTVHTDKFEYYSAKFDLVEVDRLVGKTGIKNIDRQNLDLDICVACMERMKATVVANIKKREDSGGWSTSVELPKPESKPKPAAPRPMGAVAQKIQPPQKVVEERRKEKPEVLDKFEFVAFSAVKDPPPGCELKLPEPELPKPPEPPKPPMLPPEPPQPPKLPSEPPKPPAPFKMTSRLTRPQNLNRPDLPPGPAAPVIKKAQEPPK